jgi:hypothetical protein
MNLIRSIFWVLLFIGSAFCFIVLFEHGVTNFGENSQKEVKALKALVGMADKKPAEPAK